MMSAGRQDITGRKIKNLLIWGVGLCVLWWLPLLAVHWWPQLLISSKEPWLLDISDLTWRRVVVNLATKPGFRAVWMAVWSLGWMAVLWAPAPAFRRSSLRNWGKRLSRVNFRSSMEWVMDGKPGSALKEYARLVEVI